MLQQISDIARDMQMLIEEMDILKEHRKVLAGRMFGDATKSNEIEQKIKNINAIISKRKQNFIELLQNTGSDYIA